ncbi:MAG: OB-fold domain-containing protein [Rhodospirillales bacterium]|nr:OB-fold domain-containing protein [Rhodospirillales bacterium]
MTYTKPLPKPDPLLAPFWAAARAGHLALPVCRACGHAHFPPGPVCPACLAPDIEWRAASGAGTLESWIAMHRAYWDGFRDDLPYPVGLVRLTEGPLLVSNLVGDLSGARLGAPVRAVFDAVTETVTLPKFTLAA